MGGGARNQGTPACAGCGRVASNLRKAAEMGFMLSDQEAVAVRWALENYLPGLRFTEARIERERDRHELVQLEERLSALLARLEQPADYPQEPAAPP
jgi:hypothetical protein